MRIEIVRPDGDLKREVWEFDLCLSYHPACIYFESYVLQTKESKRKRIWQGLTWWVRLPYHFKTNNIPIAPLPIDVEAEMRKRYQDYILTLPIVR